MDANPEQDCQLYSVEAQSAERDDALPLETYHLHDTEDRPTKHR